MTLQIMTLPSIHRQLQQVKNQRGMGGYMGDDLQLSPDVYVPAYPSATDQAASTAIYDATSLAALTTTTPSTAVNSDTSNAFGAGILSALQGALPSAVTLAKRQLGIIPNVTFQPTTIPSWALPAAAVAVGYMLLKK